MTPHAMRQLTIAQLAAMFEWLEAQQKALQG